MFVPRCVALCLLVARQSSKSMVPQCTSRLHGSVFTWLSWQCGHVGHVKPIGQVAAMFLDTLWILYFYLILYYLYFLHLLASCHHCHPHLPRGCSAWDMGRAPGIKAWRTGCEYTSLLRCICCMLVWDRLGTCASCGINSASTNCHRLSIARKHVPARGKRKSILFLWGAPRERETFLACFGEKCCR